MDHWVKVVNLEVLLVLSVLSCSDGSTLKLKHMANQQSHNTFWWRNICVICHNVIIIILVQFQQYSRTPLIRPPSESHWCGRIRGMVAREGFVYEQKPLSVTRNVVVWEGWSLVRVVVRQGFYCTAITSCIRKRSLGVSKRSNQCDVSQRSNQCHVSYHIITCRSNIINQMYQTTEPRTKWDFTLAHTFYFTMPHHTCIVWSYRFFQLIYSGTIKICFRNTHLQWMESQQITSHVVDSCLNI